MKNSPLAIALLIALTCLTAVNVHKAYGIEKTLTTLIEEETMTTSWTSSRGTETVPTVQLEGEDWEDLLDRHDARVAAAKKRWPDA